MSREQNSASLLDCRDVSLRGHSFRVIADRDVTRKFWQVANSGWEDDTLSFITKHVTPGTTTVDVGAWIGPITLLASRLGGRVLALEPDPVAHRDLMVNIGLNNVANVEVLNAGLDLSEGTLSLYASGEFGNSTTSSYAMSEPVEIKVPTLTLQQLARRLEGASKIVVKVDIEGHEYNIADHLVLFVINARAPLHISMHPLAYYQSVRRNSSLLRAKFATWRATRNLIAKLRTIGSVINTKSGLEFTTFDLFRLIFLRSRAKNFTLEVVP